MPKKRANITYQMFEPYLQTNNLPIPVREHKFHETRKWRLDFAWLDYKIALEVNGGVWRNGRHTRGTGYINDLEKITELSLLGWIIIQVVPKDLMTDKTIEYIKKALNLRVGNGQN